MKVLPFNIPKTEVESFRVQVDRMPYFYDILHQHPEIQVTAIIAGHGNRFIGDQLGNFAEGEILVIGPNIPHLLKCEGVFYQGNEELKAHSVSIFFKENSLGEGFFSLPELLRVRELIKKSRQGLIISGENKNILFEKIIQLPQKDGLEKIIDFLEILKLLSTPEAQQTISPLPFFTTNKEEDANRLNEVIQFIMKNFQQPISLDTISETAHLSPAAFCRFFKLRTRKTFTAFLNEVRIGHSRKLLRESEHPINEICYQVGFNNLSHFNRLFKIQTDITPSLYRKKTREGE